MARDIYIAIMVAAAKGQGVHLSADEVGQLTLDDAIKTAALNGLSESEFSRIDIGLKSWRSINPWADRVAANMASGDGERPFADAPEKPVV